MPHVCTGLIVWGFLSSIFLDSGELFTGSESFIKQIRLPYSLYVCRFIFAKTVAFAHDLPIYLALVLYFQIWPGLVVLYAIPGFAVLMLNGALASMSLGIVSARFRDIPRIITSLIQIVFLITPIIWMPEMLGSRGYISAGNPFFHLIEIVRAPLLGAPPTLQTVVATALITTINSVVALMLFSKYRHRIAYWV